MDIIRQNVTSLRDNIQRNYLAETTVIDVFTAMYIILQKQIDYAISDDKYFAFLLGCLRNVPPGTQREYWFNMIFTTYEKLSNIDPNDTNWLLLKANLVYLAPHCC